MNHEIVLAPEILGYIGVLPVSNTLLVSLIVSLFLIIISMVTTWKVKAIPSGLQNFFELIIETGYQTVEDLAHSKAKTFFPWVMTFFIFIITANWFGLFPGFATIGFYKQSLPAGAGETQHEAETQEVQQLPEVTKNEITVDDHGIPVESHQDSTSPVAIAHEESHAKPHQVFVPLLRSINSDLNMTLALALVSAFMTHFFAIRYLGIIDYLKKWFTLNPIFLFVGLLELVGEFTKIVSLSFRLFGNIFAGEVVLSTVATLAPFTAFLVPLPFYFLEIIVGFVQAAVFMMLTLVFMTLLSEKHEAH